MILKARIAIVVFVLAQAGLVSDSSDAETRRFVEALLGAMGERLKVYSDVLDFDEFFVDDLELVEPVGGGVPATDEEAADVVAALGLVVAQIHVLVVDAHDLHLARLVRHTVARAARQTGPAL